MKRTKKKIADEIAALKSLRPEGIWALKTAATIKLTISVLQDGFDTTSEEFEELSIEDQMAATDAINWCNGDSDEKPSTSFSGLVEEP